MSASVDSLDPAIMKEKLFFRFDEDSLSIGGRSWNHCKRENAHIKLRMNDKPFIRKIESQLLKILCESQIWKDQLILWQNNYKRLDSNESKKHRFSIVVLDFWLHDWKPLLLSLCQHNVPLTGIVLRFESAGGLSEQGAQTLGWALNPRQSGFKIQHLHFHSQTDMNEETCRLWIQNGLLGVVVKHLSLNCSPSWFLPLLLQHCRPHYIHYDWKLDYRDYEYIYFEMMMDHPKVGEAGNEHHGDDFVETFEIYLSDTTTQASLQMIANILCKIRVQTLALNSYDLPTMMHGKHYDLFKDAKYCDEITWMCQRHDKLPFDGLASLVNKDSLKILRLVSYHDGENDRDFCHIDWLLRIANLSFLDTLQIETIWGRGAAFSFLCDQLAENKGPRCLDITIDEPDNMSHDTVFEIFGASLRANTKVEKLKIEMTFLEVTASVCLQFIQRVCGMPRLTSFELNRYHKYSEIDCSLLEQKRTLLQHIAKSNTIQHVRIPFDDDGLGIALDEIVRFQELLRRGNDISDGIWARALGRTRVRANAMYYAVQQMPRLFQLKGTDKNDVVEPMFTVPHHPDCPGCRRHFELQASKRARIS